MNHQAIIAKVEKTIPIEGADRVQIALVLGEYCVVGKDVNVGDVGVLFPTDLQLSEEYCRVNNLHRDASLNFDSNKKGFFDKNRRVRTQKFLGVNSTAYFSNLESLSYTGIDAVQMESMYKFNDIGEHHICKRYESEEVKNKKANVQNSKSRKVSEVPLFLKHKDTEQFTHNLYKIPVGALLSFHSKAHGTSGRYSYLPVIQSLPKWKQLVNKYINIFPTEEYDYVVGTRNVVLKTPDKEGWHGIESFRFEIMEQLKPHLVKGMCIYLEIVGNVNGKPIMPPHDIGAIKSKEYSDKYGGNVQYNYGCKEHEFKFFIYRITMTGTDGEIYEFDQKRLEKWCQDRGIEHTLEIHPQVVYDGNEDSLKELVNNLTERPEVLTEDYRDSSHLSEGVILRVDFNGRTDFYKQKSIAFKLCEGILKVDDIEELS